MIGPLMILDLPTTNKYITSSITKVIKQKTNILPKKTLKKPFWPKFLWPSPPCSKKKLTMLTLSFHSHQWRLLLLRPGPPSRSNSRPNSSQGRALRNDRPTSAVSITSKSSKSSCLGWWQWGAEGRKVRGAGWDGEKAGLYQRILDSLDVKS